MSQGSRQDIGRWKRKDSKQKENINGDGNLSSQTLNVEVLSEKVYQYMGIMHEAGILGTDKLVTAYADFTEYKDVSCMCMKTPIGINMFGEGVSVKEDARVLARDDFKLSLPDKLMFMGNLIINNIDKVKLKMLNPSISDLPRAGLSIKNVHYSNVEKLEHSARINRGLLTNMNIVLRKGDLADCCSHALGILSVCVRDKDTTCFQHNMQPRWVSVIHFIASPDIKLKNISAMINRSTTILYGEVSVGVDEYSFEIYYMNDKIISVTIHTFYSSINEYGRKIHIFNYNGKVVWMESRMNTSLYYESLNLLHYICATVGCKISFSSDIGATCIDEHCMDTGCLILDHMICYTLLAEKKALPMYVKTISHKIFARFAHKYNPLANLLLRIPSSYGWCDFKKDALVVRDEYNENIPKNLRVYTPEYSIVCIYMFCVIMLKRREDYFSYVNVHRSEPYGENQVKSINGKVQFTCNSVKKKIIFMWWVYYLLFIGFKQILIQALLRKVYYLHSGEILTRVMDIDYNCSGNLYKNFRLNDFLSLCISYLNSKRPQPNGCERLLEYIRNVNESCDKVNNGKQRHHKEYIGFNIRDDFDCDTDYLIQVVLECALGTTRVLDNIRLTIMHWFCDIVTQKLLIESVGKICMLDENVCLRYKRSCLSDYYYEILSVLFLGGEKFNYMQEGDKYMIGLIQNHVDECDSFNTIVIGDSRSISRYSFSILDTLGSLFCTRKFDFFIRDETNNIIKTKIFFSKELIMHIFSFLAGDSLVQHK